jgi:hypothetical protein
MKNAWHHRPVTRHVDRMDVDRRSAAALQGAATIGLELVDTVPSFRRRPDLLSAAER